jgi:tRNA pseudouridine55 synthase
LDEVSPGRIIPLASAATSAFPKRQLSDSETIDLRHGKRISGAEIVGDYAGIDVQGNLVAMLVDDGAKAKSTCVFASEA